MFQKLIVAIDNSDISQQVFDKAVFLAEKSNAKLMLLHVLNPLDEPRINPFFVRSDINPEEQAQKNEKYIKDWEKLKEERSKWLHSRYEEAKKLGIDTELNQCVGEESRTICDAARKWGADLIVIGRRGRRGLSELFLGSVSNYVLHHAPCSVVVVQQSVKTNNEKVPQTDKLETGSTN